MCFLKVVGHRNEIDYPAEKRFLGFQTYAALIVHVGGFLVHVIEEREDIN